MSEVSPVKRCVSICLAGLLLTEQLVAAPLDAQASPAISMEDALATARRAAPGKTTGVDLDCPSADHCGYQVRIVSQSGQASTVFVAGEAGQSSDANQPPPTQQASQGMAPAELPAPGLRAQLYGLMSTGTGQVAGLGNVILYPKLQAGVGMALHHSDFPQWDADARLQLIYGRTASSDPVTLSKSVNGSALQEYRGQAHLIYNFHQDGEAAKAGVGLYVDLERPIRSAPRYVPPTYKVGYAMEEGEVAHRILDTGVDFRFKVKQQRLASELHNVIFLSGTRIAPNLLTYKPMLAFMWGNAFSITGTVDHPGWSFLTDVEFYFARKAGVRYLNLHDGLGGTKRELGLSYGVAYDVNPLTRVSLKSYGFNNLNRGSSSAVPAGFKDGFTLSVVRQFE